MNVSPDPPFPNFNFCGPWICLWLLCCNFKILLNHKNKFNFSSDRVTRITQVFQSSEYWWQNTSTYQNCTSACQNINTKSFHWICQITSYFWGQIVGMICNSLSVISSSCNLSLWNVMFNKLGRIHRLKEHDKRRNHQSFKQISTGGHMTSSLRAAWHKFLNGKSLHI